MIRGCEHIGIQVCDVERSARFYEENLGFERVARWTMAQPYVQKVVGYYPDVTLQIALLSIPGSDVFLEILEYENVKGTPVDPATGNPGTAHFCLMVDELDGLYADLVKKGVEFVSEVQVPTAGPNKGGRVVYMKDPDGIRVELVQSSVRSDGRAVDAGGRRS